MKILFVGDVVGQGACEALKGFLPGFKRGAGIDITIINGENSADGNGISPLSAKLLFQAGADLITTGNHCYKRADMDNAFNDNPVLLRPANYGEHPPGKGIAIIDKGSYSVAVINLVGTTFMPVPIADNPFKCADEILCGLDTRNIIVDFHAEATAEKKALGYYLAERVSAVVGTHTHVQTADEQILAGHTAYITDVGMTGVDDSVIGVDKTAIIERFCTCYPKKHQTARGKFTINAVVIEIDQKTGKSTSINRINQEI
ncbi:MAG: TIGR00282 family metallophosphoesterase [Oscillospiraceae bacterium]|nr:TIGR00282 family metallophosphoesterase [Oscillospiraceae bacterium]